MNNQIKKIMRSNKMKDEDSLSFKKQANYLDDLNSNEQRGEGSTIRRVYSN